MNEKANKLLYMALSLVAAILFWLYVDNVQGNTVDQPFHNIPVEFIGQTDTLPSRNLMMVDGADATVDIVISGPRTTVTGLSVEDFSIQVDLSNINSAGTYPLAYNVITPPGLSRSAISIEKTTQNVVVTIAELFEKEIPVEVDVVGKTQTGYTYMSDKLEVNPSFITLQGREEDIESIASARVVLDLTDADFTILKDFRYDLLDVYGNVVENDGAFAVSDRYIQLHAPIYVIRDLALIVRWKESPGSMLENVDWNLEPSTITVAGDPQLLGDRTEIVLGEVDLSALLNDARQTLNIKLPAGCANISGYTSTVLTIDFHEELTTKTFSVTNISAYGLGQGMEATRLTNSVDVLLRGPAEQLDLITPEDIRIVADLGEFSASGKYSVTAEVLVDGPYDQVGAAGSYSVYYEINAS